MKNIFSLTFELKNLAWSKCFFEGQPVCFGQKSSFLNCLENQLGASVSMTNIQQVFGEADKDYLINVLFSEHQTQYWFRYAQIFFGKKLMGQTMVWLPKIYDEVLKILEELKEKTLGSWLFKQTDCQLVSRFYAKDHSAYFQLSCWQVSKAKIYILEQMYVE